MKMYHGQGMVYTTVQIIDSWVETVARTIVCGLMLVGLFRIKAPIKSVLRNGK